MSEHVFYSTANNHHHRELTIVNAALLVSKPPTKEKRIRIKVRMLLSNGINMGSPEWLDRAFAYVSENHDIVQPSIEFKGYDLHFSADNLFDKDGVKAPRCQMRSFEIHECGDSEEPDVAASFTLYAPFSTALWAWLGQFGGEECWCSFTPGVSEEPKPTGTDDQLTLTSGSDEDEEEEESDEFEDEEAEEIDAESDLDPDNEIALTDVVEDGTDDVMLQDALHVIEQEGKVSVGAIQRVLSINYTKAVGLVDKLEAKGLVSKPDVNGVRTLKAQGKAAQSKSGAKDLAAYHEQVLDAEAGKNVVEMPVKKGRGRPKGSTNKPKVDPLTVDEAVPF